MNMLRLVFVVSLLVGCGTKAPAVTRGAVEPRTSAPPKAPPSTSPYVLVLGTAQDAGLPQIGCTGQHCVRAARDPAQRRFSSAILLCDPRTGMRWLFDATPDLREQLHFANGHPSSRQLPGSRPPLVEGIFLTHAHIGHYTGLMFLGRESYGAKQVPVFGTERMRDFLTNNGPWSQLVSLGNIELRPIAPPDTVKLAADLSVQAIPVVHRDEFSDTVAFIVRGPERALLYLPDIDKWSRWDTRIEEVLAKVDFALLDGTFFDGDEVPARAMSEIPHPFIRESLDRFGPLSLDERRKVVFTHMNHSNPAHESGGEAAVEIEKAGMSVAYRGQVFPL